MRFILLLVFPFLALLSCKDASIDNKKIFSITAAHRGNERKQVTIMIQPFGEISAQKVNFIQKEILSFYSCREVRIADAAALPKMAWYAPRKRYVADSLLTHLWANRPAGVDHVIGLLDEDIATRKGNIENYGVMGLGACPGSVCVVSTFRLKMKMKNQQHFLERYSKVCLHELGHNLGLPHCSGEEKCFMNDAGGTIAQVDKEEKWLCDNCRNKVGPFLP